MTPEEEKRRAKLRIVLGNAQMAAAAATLVLVWRLGVSTASVTAAVVTGALLVTSLVLFRLR